MKGVYFIQVGESGPVKIGYAADVRKRLSELQMSSPWQLHLRSVIAGARLEERALHARFSEHRIRGEWFAPDAPGLADVMADNRVSLVPDGYVGTEEFARFCGLCVETVRKGARDGDFAHIRIGNALYFHLEDVIASLSKRVTA